MMIEIWTLITSSGHGLTEKIHKGIARMVELFCSLIGEVVIKSVFISQTYQFDLFLIRSISCIKYISIYEY